MQLHLPVVGDMLKLLSPARSDLNRSPLFERVDNLYFPAPRGASVFGYSYIGEGGHNGYIMCLHMEAVQWIQD